MNNKIVRRGLDYYMELEALEGEAYEYHMLMANQIAYLLPMNLENINEQKQLSYEITNCSNFVDVFDKTWISSRQLKEIVEAILNGVKSVKEYLLSPDNLVLEKEYLFVDDGSLKLRFLYVPGYKKDILEQLRELMGYLIEKIDKNNPETVMLAWKLYLLMKESKVSLQAIEGCLEEHYREEKPAKEEKRDSSGKEKETLGKKLWICAAVAFGILFLMLCGMEGYILFQIYYGGILEWKRNLLLVTTFFLVLCALFLFYIIRKIKTDKEVEDIFTAERESELEEERKIRQVFLSGETTLLRKEQINNIPKLSFMEEDRDIYIYRTPFVLGKNPRETDYILDSPAVSRIHARILQNNGQYYLEDLSSTNGTFINEIKLETEKEYKIQSGDHICIADIKFRFLT